MQENHQDIRGTQRKEYLDTNEEVVSMICKKCNKKCKHSHFVERIAFVFCPECKEMYYDTNSARESTRNWNPRGDIK